MQRTNSLHIVRFSTLAVVFAACALTILSCKEPAGGLVGNTPPRTRLANVPVNDTIAVYIRNGAIPEVALHWVGDDQDGFIIAYMYRWTSWRSPIPDSIVSTSKPWTTVLNLVQVGGVNVPNMILVKSLNGSLFKLYNFLATLDPAVDTAITNTINDSLETLRPFAVPYRTGIVPGDSLVGGSNLENIAPTKGQFIFSSLADSNMHRFQVRSVDNDDAIDPAPAVVHFWTLQTRGPLMRFISPTGGTGGAPIAGSYAIRYRTELWPGLRFTFASSDPSTFDQEFSWKVDSVTTGNDSARWSPWSASNDAFVSALDFSSTATDTHKFYVRGRNRFGAIGPVKDTTFIVTIPRFDDPTWPRQTLIINNNVTTTPVSNYNPDSNMVKAFYSEVMDSLGFSGRFRIFTTQSRSDRFPTRREFGDYSTVLIASEYYPKLTGTNRVIYIFNAARQAQVKEYLAAGGNLLFGGVQDIDLYIQGTFVEWADSVFHMNPSFLFPPLFVKNRSLDFVGAKAIPGLGYPDVTLDSSKIHPDSSVVVGGERKRALRGIVLGYPRGFADNITLFDSGRDSAGFEDQPLSVRFLAPPAVPPAQPTYSVIYFGFPLYLAEKSAVIGTLRRAYLDFNE